MPTWSGILTEIGQELAAGEPSPYDKVRRRYLVAVARHSGRPAILYATRFTQGGNFPPDLLSITEEDGQGLMEVVHGLPSDSLDLILHSPGGSPVAAEAFVTYLRSKFSHIRVVVPHLAMSAATMVACAADVIVMGKHSFLGPTDPQLVLQTPLGVRMVPAHAIRQQFDQAARECSDPARIGAYLPMLPQFGPDLLAQCLNVCALSRELVAGWLQKYMFKDDPDGATKAQEIAGWLSEHGTHKMHGRHLSRDQLLAKGLRVEPLERDQTEQDLFLSVLHATTHTFSNTTAVKIIENNLGKAFIKQVRIVQTMPPMQAPPEDDGSRGPATTRPKPKPSARPGAPKARRSASRRANRKRG